MNRTTPQQNYRFPLTVLTAIFFAWGFITCLNDILIPHLKEKFELSYLQSALVQFCFFFAFFVMSIPSGAIINRLGYKRGMVVGLCVTGLGAFLFYPATTYGWFLGALFILATGITVLQVAANPYVALLGPPELGASRLNMAQAVNSLGTTLAPIIGGVLVLGNSSVRESYLGIAGVLMLLAAIFFFLRLPEPEHATADGDEKGLWAEALKRPQLMLGALGIFVYVGAEVSIGSFLVSFITQPEILGIGAKDAANYVSIYWGCAMIGRFVGSAVQTRVAPSMTLAAAGVAALLLVGGAVATKGPIAMALLLAVGLFNSIMFPTIFSLGVRDLGRLTGIGSSILIMAIVGGALIPLGMGAAADHFGIQAALLLPACCYVVIAYYGFWVGGKNGETLYSGLRARGGVADAALRDGVGSVTRRGGIAH